MRMKIDDLTPAEYWRTSAFDYEMALTLQNVRHEGFVEGRKERRKEEERKRERERREEESMRRLEAKMGRL